MRLLQDFENKHGDRYASHSALMILVWNMLAKTTQSTSFQFQESPTISPKIGREKLLGARSWLVLQTPQGKLVHAVVCNRRTDKIPTQQPPKPATPTVPTHSTKLWSEGPILGGCRLISTPSVHPIKKLYRKSRGLFYIMRGQSILPCWQHLYPLQHRNPTQRSTRWKEWNNY